MLNLDSATILVSTRKIAADGSESHDAFFGRVLRFNENTVIVLKLTGGEFSMPYDEGVIRAADPGFYELDDGEVFDNPNFIAEWVVYESENTWNTYRNLKNTPLGNSNG